MAKAKSCIPAGLNTVTAALIVDGAARAIEWYRKVFNNALEHGAKVTMPLEDEFWGDRWGGFTDPFGQNWSVATHKEDLTPAETRARGEEFFKKYTAQHT